jgi:hypothetical protein
MVLLFAIRLAEGAAPRPTDARRCVTYATERSAPEGLGGRASFGMLSCGSRGFRCPRADYRTASHSPPPGAEKAGVSDCLTCRAGLANWQRAICAAAIASARNAAFRRPSAAMRWSATSRSPSCVWAHPGLSLRPQPRRPMLLRFKTRPCRSVVMIVLVRSCGRRKTFYRRS